MSAGTASRDAPPDFKHTEIGILPNDWDPVRIDACASIKTGSRNTQDRVEDGLYPFFVRSEQIERINSFSHDCEAVLTAGDGVGTGKVFHYVQGRFDVHQRVYKISDFSDELSGKYFFYQFSARFYDRIMSMTAKSSVDSVRMEMIAGMKIPLPPIEEQRAITKALSDVDALIGTVENLIVKKRAIKQATMQQFLTGKTRLPGFKAKWDVRRLADIVIDGPKNGYSGSAEVNYRGTPTLRLTATTSGVLVLNETTTKRLNRTIPSGSDLFLRSGDVLLQRSNTLDLVGTTVVYDGPPDIYIYPDLLMRLRFRSGPTASWFANYANSAQGRTFFIRAAAGSTGSMPKISGAVLRTMRLPLPPLPEQEAIVTIFADLDRDILKLQKRRDKILAVKQGMMQQLLTGRIRLVKSNLVAPQADVKSRGNKAHSWAFNEAVVIATLAKNFGSEQFPLGRKRYTKLSYLLHRYAERQTEGYLKKSAGPYNPKTKYGGPERIAVENGYVREHRNGAYSGFVTANNITQAEAYFERWYGSDCLRWLAQFRLKRNDDLELLATVDMAATELRAGAKNVDLASVKDIISGHSEWQAKLDRLVFSDANIAKAIETSLKLFG